MKKKAFLTLAVLVTSLALLTASAQAMPPGGPGKGPGEKSEMMAPGGPHMMASLNLTDGQIEKLKEEKFTKRKRMIQLRSERETLELDLEKELSADQPNLGKVEKIAKKMGEHHSQMVVQRAQSLIFLKSILTDEQKKVLDAHQLAPGNHGMQKMKGKRHGKGKR